MKSIFSRAGLALSLSLIGVLLANCGSGTTTIAAPSAASIRTALGANNPRGMVPGFALGAITLPACTKGDGSVLDYAVTYGLTNLPAWLAFDATSLAVTLATGTTIPAEAMTASQVTFTCTDASDSTITASATFTINDLDNGSVVDGEEYNNGAVPLLNNNGYFVLNPATVDRYRVGPAPFRIPTGIARPTAGMNPLDEADDTADFDGDTFNNFDEIVDLTNPFVRATAGQFQAAITSAVSSGPFAITSADFNRDGRLDAAMTLSGTNQVALLTGNGNGTFGAEADFGVGHSPWGIVAADFNGDGNMDLAAVNNFDSNISVLLGNGQGGFATQVNYGVGFGPTFITAADFNNDGIVDLAVVSQVQGFVSILLGAGDGTFGAKTDDATGTSPAGIAAADFNGDGNMDLAVANNFAGVNTFSVLLGTGAGTFNAKTDYATGTQPSYLVSADFNGDSILDIAVTTNASTVAVNLGAGDGSFGAPQEFATGTTPRSLIAADLNGDKKVDLATTNSGAGAFSVSVLLGVGDGTFSAKTDYPLPTQPVYLTASDLNADGTIDLAVALTGAPANVGALLD